MLDVVLVDDEVLSLEQLEYILKGFDNIKILGVFDDSVEAIKEIKKIKPHVVMLDISMPQINGFELASLMQDMRLNTYVIFITSHDEFALKAFEVQAVDYILKPFSKQRIKKALDRVEERMAVNQQNQGNLNDFVQRYINYTELSCIPVWKKDSIVLLNISDIYYCTVEDKKTYICTDHECYLSNDTLNSLEKKFRSKKFVRCYRSYIVNLDYVDKIVPMFNQTYIIKLRGMDFEIPVSRHYGQELKALLGF